MKTKTGWLLFALLMLASAVGSGHDGVSHGYFQFTPSISKLEHNTTHVVVYGDGCWRVQWADSDVWVTFQPGEQPVGVLLPFEFKRRVPHGVKDCPEALVIGYW